MEDFYEESQEESLEDDLADFQEYQVNKVTEEVMNRISHVEDDAKLIRDKPQEAPKKELKPKITEEQLKARELKQLNSRKYFELAKVMYIQHICTSIQKTREMTQNAQQTVTKWLSLLPPVLLSDYARLKKTKSLSISISDLLRLLKKGKEHISRQKKHLNWSAVFWSICYDLQLSCRKIFFFNIDSIVEEVFFQLKYYASDVQRKKENKKSKQYHAMKMGIEKQIEENIQSQQDESNSYLQLEDFEFDEVSFKEKKRMSVDQISKLSQSQDRNQKRQLNFLRKKNFKDCYFQLFDPSTDKWVLINSQILQVQEHDKSRVTFLEGKFIIGFHAIRLLHFKDELNNYVHLRQMKEYTIEDLTKYFEDNHRILASRRKRLGLKGIMKHIYQETSLGKKKFLLSNYDAYIMSKDDQIELDYQLNVFPKTKDEMMMSPYFVIPSQLPKYCILDASAQPIPDIMFNQERVFLRRDLIAVTSRLFWVDRGRKVKYGEVPVKKTENKSKNLTQLFLYEQTMPFELSVDPITGNFIADDQYNSMYIPSDFQPPPQMKIIKHKIGVVSSRAKIRHVKLIQGFIRSMGRILPNQIGYLVYANDEERILMLQQERRIKLQQGKTKNRLKQLSSLWNKLFKKIEISQWSKSFQRNL